MNDGLKICRRYCKRREVLHCYCGVAVPEPEQFRRCSGHTEVCTAVSAAGTSAIKEGGAGGKTDSVARSVEKVKQERAAIPNCDVG